MLSHGFQTYIAQLKRLFGPELATFTPADLTADFVRERIEAQQASEIHGNSTNPGGALHTSTKHRYRVAVSMFLNHLRDEKQIDHNPVNAYGVPFAFTEEEMEELRDPKHYTEEEMRALLAWAPKDAAAYPGGRVTLDVYRACIALMFGACMEWGVLKTLRKRDFGGAKWIKALGAEKGARIVRMKGTKGKGLTVNPRDREAPIYFDWCWAVVAPYLATLNPGDFFLPRVDVRVETNAPEALRDKLREVHALACEETGIEDRAFHAMRHGHINIRLDKGDPIRVIQEQAGHSEKSMTLILKYKQRLTEKERVARFAEML